MSLLRLQILFSVVKLLWNFCKFGAILEDCDGGSVAFSSRFFHRTHSEIAPIQKTVMNGLLKPLISTFDKVPVWELRICSICVNGFTCPSPFLPPPPLFVGQKVKTGVSGMALNPPPPLSPPPPRQKTCDGHLATLCIKGWGLGLVSSIVLDIALGPHLETILI